MKEAFLSGFYGAARLFVDLVRAPFLVMRDFIIQGRPRPRPGPFHGCHVEHHHRRRAA